MGGGVVIFMVLLVADTCDPLLQRRKSFEHRYVREVIEQHSAKTAWLPWQAVEPIGPDALAQLGATVSFLVPVTA
jgi:hypothetical protein